MGSIDYSKWNNLSLSDEDSDKECQECLGSHHHQHHQQEFLKELLVTKQIQRGEQLPKCSCCMEVIKSENPGNAIEKLQKEKKSDSGANSPPIPVLSKIKTPLCNSASTSPRKSTQKLYGQPSKSYMPNISFSFKGVEKPLPGMLTKMPTLPAQYANSPIQRMQYR
jgi:hypothetical protein